MKLSDFLYYHGSPSGPPLVLGQSGIYCLQSEKPRDMYALIWRRHIQKTIYSSRLTSGHALSSYDAGHMACWLSETAWLVLLQVRKWATLTSGPFHTFLLNEGTFIQDTMFHGCLHGRQIPIEELDQGCVMAISKNMPDHQNQSQNGNFLIYSNMQIWQPVEHNRGALNSWKYLWNFIKYIRVHNIKITTTV